jgi:excisionase family DNA binding protein
MIDTPPIDQRAGLEDLPQLTDLTGGDVPGDSTWLTFGETLARLRAAGFTESESTVRRMIDDGEIESYRTERGPNRRGHRRIKAESVDALIRRRNDPHA